MGGYRTQIIVGLIFQEVVHRRISPPAFLEGEKLIEKVASRLTGKAWKIVVAGTLSLGPVARGARLHPCSHRVSYMVSGLRQAHMACEQQRAEQDHYVRQPKHRVHISWSLASQPAYLAQVIMILLLASLWRCSRF
jgi:hypothetical protein